MWTGPNTWEIAAVVFFWLYSTAIKCFGTIVKYEKVPTMQSQGLYCSLK